LLKLKRVEIQGFKSFCDRTEMRFHDSGIAAVVGPNGCGKLDAGSLHVAGPSRDWASEAKVTGEQLAGERGGGVRVGFGGFSVGCRKRRVLGFTS
jgi:ABC-type phosphate transport system ATPase subunit